MVQKYQNESAPIFYYGKSPKTNRKHLKIPYLQALTLGHVIKMTLYYLYLLFQPQIELEASERQKKFLNYWMTITKSTTITSYTTTSTFSAIACTPPNFPYGGCAGQGTGKKKRAAEDK